MKKHLIPLLILLLFSFVPFFLSKEPNYLPTKSIILNRHSTEYHNNSNELLNENGITPKYDAQEYIGLKNNFGNFNLTGYNITVAILDTGVYTNHSVFTEDFSQNWSKRIKAFYDESIGGENMNPYDAEWHGTWTASILGGNSTSYRGVAPGVNYVIVKLFYEDNGEIITTLPILTDGINWIIENKEKYNIKIASMSFGIKPLNSILEYIKKIEESVQKLTSEGILVVAAAGNDGDAPENDGFGTINAPASARSVLAVGGVDYEGNMYSKSSKGPTYNDVMKPDVCAPAVSIYGAYSDDPPNDFIYASGTSAATPFVAGLAALLLEKNKDLTPFQLKNIISLTSFRSREPRKIKDNIQGWGIIQGYAALDALKDPIIYQQNTEIHISLTENYTVACIPISLTPNHYFFELVQLNTSEAEMFLFDEEPDEWGNPILKTHTINPFSSSNRLKRMGIFTIESHNYYLLIKSFDSKVGNFLIRLIFEFRNMIFIGFLILNSIGIIYIIRLNKNFKNRKGLIYKNS